MPDLYDLTRDHGIKKLTLSAGGYTKKEETLLVLSDKPEQLKNKEINLRYAGTREWDSSPPEAFFAKAGTFSELAIQLSPLAKDGWRFKYKSDPDGNRTNKNYYIRIENRNSNQVYIGVPITKSHFNGGRDPVIDDLLIVDEQSFLDNPNFAMSLNHQKINIEAENGHWNVAKDNPLAGILKVPGRTIEANNPEEIYLLTEAELRQYNKDGERKGWSEVKTDNKEELRTFVKKEYKNGVYDPVDKRFAKEIMVPQIVDGEEKLVKHFLLSDKKTLESLEIMAPTTKDSVHQENAAGTVPETPEPTAQEIAEATNPSFKFNPSDQAADKADVQDKTATQGESEMPEIADGPPIEAYEGIPEEQIEGGVQAGHDSEIEPEMRGASEEQSGSEQQGASKKKKVELTGLALEIFNRIADKNGGTVTPLEKAFLDDLNMIQDDPKKTANALASIQNSPDHINIIKQFMKSGNENKVDENNKNTPNDQPPDAPSTTKVNGVEAAAGLALGAAGAVIQGVTKAVGATVNGAVDIGGKIAKGTVGEISNIVQNHQKRKQYRLEHPEIVEQERVAARQKLMAARQAVAEDSNRILDANIESVIASKEFIEKNPAVQQMLKMIEADPSQRKHLGEWLEDAADGNPVFAEHLANLQENAGDVARSMEENLKANSLADGDLQARKGAFDKFNEAFANDSLADALSDKGAKVPDGEQRPSIRESITKAINAVMKMLKNMMMDLLSKFKKGQGETMVQGKIAEQGKSITLDETLDPNVTAEQVKTVVQKETVVSDEYAEQEEYAGSRMSRRW